MIEILRMINSLRFPPSFHPVRMAQRLLERRCFRYNGLVAIPSLGGTFSFFRFKTGMASLNLRSQFLRNAESAQIFLKIPWHLRQILTGPSICTTANEKVYIAGDFALLAQIGKCLRPTRHAKVEL